MFGFDYLLSGRNHMHVHRFDGRGVVFGLPNRFEHNECIDNDRGNNENNL